MTAVLLYLANVWGAVPPRVLSIEATSIQGGSELAWRASCCDLLFLSPGKLGLSSRYLFDDADSSANYEELACLLSTPRRGRFETPGYAFSILTRALRSDRRRYVGGLSATMGPGDPLKTSEIALALRGFAEENSSIPLKDVRGHFLCREASLLLLGLSRPAQAGIALAALSNQALRVSPTIAQTACIHAIKLLFMAKQPARAERLFATGKRIFAPGNPTNYVDKFWIPRPTRVPVWSGDKPPKYALVQDHVLSGWKY